MSGLNAGEQFLDSVGVSPVTPNSTAQELAAAAIARAAADVVAMADELSADPNLAQRLKATKEAIDAFESFSSISTPGSADLERIREALSRSLSNGEVGQVFSWMGTIAESVGALVDSGSSPVAQPRKAAAGDSRRTERKRRRSVVRPRLSRDQVVGAVIKVLEANRSRNGGDEAASWMSVEDIHAVLEGQRSDFPSPVPGFQTPGQGLVNNLAAHMSNDHRSLGNRSRLRREGRSWGLRGWQMENGGGTA